MYQPSLLREGKGHGGAGIHGFNGAFKDDIDPTLTVHALTAQIQLINSDQIPVGEVLRRHIKVLCHEGDSTTWGLGIENKRTGGNRGFVRSRLEGGGRLGGQFKVGRRSDARAGTTPHRRVTLLPHHHPTLWQATTTHQGRHGVWWPVYMGSRGWLSFRFPLHYA